MDATLHALGNLLIQAIPTILFFLFLNAFLKRVLFRPLANVLEERHKQTEGARELAQQATQAADKRTSEFEAALQAARVQLHGEQERQRATWAEEQARQLAKAREEALAEIEKARADVARDVQTAQAELNQQIQTLSDQITRTLTARRAA
jgi:F-type H+-transporting ATPase subunit b